MVGERWGSGATAMLKKMMTGLGERAGDGSCGLGSLRDTGGGLCCLSSAISSGLRVAWCTASGAFSAVPARILQTSRCTRPGSGGHMPLKSAPSMTRRLSGKGHVLEIKRKENCKIITSENTQTVLRNDVGGSLSQGRPWVVQGPAED